MRGRRVIIRQYGLTALLSLDWFSFLYFEPDMLIFLMSRSGNIRVFLGYFLRCFLTKFLYLRFVIPLGLGGVGGRWSLLSKLESLDFDSSVHFCPLPSLRGPSPITSEGYSGPNRTLPTNLDGV